MIQNQAASSFDRFRRPLYLLGIALICTGAAGLVALAYVAIQLILDPASIPVVQMFFSSLEATEPLVSGNLGGKDIILFGSDSLQYMFFAALGLVLVTAGVGIANGLILGGMRLVAISAPAVKESGSNGT